MFHTNNKLTQAKVALKTRHELDILFEFGTS